MNETARDVEHATDEFWGYCEKFAIDGALRIPCKFKDGYKRLDEIVGEFAAQNHASQMSGIAQRAAEKIVDCKECGGTGVCVDMRPEHHPSCDGNCDGRCPVPAYEQSMCSCIQRVESIAAIIEQEGR
jgi:hypothetical protein